MAKNGQQCQMTVNNFVITYGSTKEVIVHNIQFIEYSLSLTAL